ncbi:MAG: hypothetical protein ACK5MK_14695 [Dysgonomonas sp.]
MKKVYFLLILIGLLLYGCNKNQTSGNEKIQYAVFKYSHFGISEVDPTNAAILITDKDSVDYLKDLFENNDLSQVCTCGYDYEIQFYDANDKIVFSELYFSTNMYMKKDDEIKKVMKYLETKMLKDPSHYIYNIKINIPSDIAVKELRSKGFLVFEMSDNMEKNTIQILYTQDFEALTKEMKKYSFVEKIEKAIDRLYIEN